MNIDMRNFGGMPHDFGCEPHCRPPVIRPGERPKFRRAPPVRRGIGAWGMASGSATVVAAALVIGLNFNTGFSDYLKSHLWYSIPEKWVEVALRSDDNFDMNQ